MTTDIHNHDDRDGKNTQTGLDNPTLDLTLEELKDSGDSPTDTVPTAEELKDSGDSPTDTVPTAEELKDSGDSPTDTVPTAEEDVSQSQGDTDVTEAPQEVETKEVEESATQTSIPLEEEVSQHQPKARLLPEGTLAPYSAKIFKDQGTLSKRYEKFEEGHKINSEFFKSMCDHAQDIRTALAACFRDFEKLSPEVKQALSARYKALSIIDGQIANLYAQAYGKLVMAVEPIEGFKDLEEEIQKNLPQDEIDPDNLASLVEDIARRLEAERFTLLRKVGEAAERAIKQHDLFVNRMMEVIDILDDAPTLAKRETSKLAMPLQQEAEVWYQPHYETLRLVFTDQIFAAVGIERCAIPESGSPIDFDTQEAVDTEESTDFPEGTVAKQVKFGYIQAGRILRPTHIVAVKKG